MTSFEENGKASLTVNRVLPFCNPLQVFILKQFGLFLPLPGGAHQFKKKIKNKNSHIMIIKQSNDVMMHCKGLLGNKGSFWMAVPTSSKPY